MKLVADKEGPLGEFLLNYFGNASKSRIKKIIVNGAIRVNDIIVKDSRHKIKTGDRIDYHKFRPVEQERTVPFPIVYEDEYLLIVEKPAGILTYGERGMPGTSVYRILLDFLKAKTDGKEKVFVVHRLDREVGGLLMFTKSEELQEKIKASWNETEKKYKALVEGRPPEKHGTIKSWLKENSALKVYSVRDHQGAKFAVTHYRMTRELAGFSLMEITLETGRKNQIRVHMFDLGCPVAGDFKYGAKNKGIKGIRLYATSLEFRHPATGKWMKCNAELPKDFLKI